MRQGGICIKFSQHTSVNAHNNKENRAFLFSPVFSPTSLQRAKNACFSLIFPKNSAFRNGFELRRSDVKKDFFCNIFRRRSVESSSDNFRFFPINTVSCDIYQKTRNQLIRKGPWVRIPPSPPEITPVVGFPGCWLFFSIRCKAQAIEHCISRSQLRAVIQMCVNVRRS